MSVDVATQTVHSTIGNREDLSNVVYRIDPYETPLFSMADKEKATNVLHEWQTQALGAVNSVNSVLDGDDLTTDTVTPTARLGNYVQTMKKVARVSGIQQAVTHAGPGGKLNEQVVLKGLELRRDVETILTRNQARDAGAFSASARLLGALPSWIFTNLVTASTSGSTTGTASNGVASRTDYTARAYSESLLKIVQQSIWNNGGKPDTIMLGGFNKQQMSQFTGRSTPMEEAASKKIVATVSIYEGDFGTQKVVANRFQRSRDVWVLQSDMWAVANVRAMESGDLSKTGDSDRKYLITDVTLVARNEKSSGAVYDVTSA